jgi:transmembrane sensor
LNTDQNHIDELITRFLTNEASRDEVRLLEQWMDASEENRKYFDGISFVHKQAVASRPVFTFDADKAWNKVHTKMHQKREEVAPVIKIIPIYKKTWFRVAASVTIIIGLSVPVFWSVNKFKVAPIARIESTDEVKNTMLADQSKVVLNKKSRISYSKGFGKTNREVTLEGEAFFDVKHDSVLPFIVKTGEAFVKDIGTSFNLKSYSDSTFIQVYVESGVVLFYSGDNPGITLLPGEVGVYDKKTKTFRKLVEVEPPSVAYTNRIFVFENNNLQNIADHLNKFYTERIEIDDPELRKMEITVTFENESLEYIARIIAETLDLKVVKQDNTWLITKE